MSPCGTLIMKQENSIKYKYSYMEISNTYFLQYLRPLLGINKKKYMARLLF